MLPHVHECTGAFLGGLGVHFIFDIAGWALAAFFGVKWFNKMRCKHHTH